MSTSFIILPNFLRPKATQRLLSATIVSAMPSFLLSVSPLPSYLLRGHPSPSPGPFPPFTAVPFSRFFLLRATLWKRQPCSILNDRSSSQRHWAISVGPTTSYRVDAWADACPLLYSSQETSKPISLSPGIAVILGHDVVYSLHGWKSALWFTTNRDTRYEYIVDRNSLVHSTRSKFHPIFFSDSTIFLQEN